MLDSRLADCTVLVVDDETLIRMVAADILLDAGCRMLEAADAASAIRVIEANPDIDVLFSDINMPGSLSGIELATEVFRRWPEIKLLITSGRKVMRSSALPDHGTFLAKPYGVDELVEAVADKFTN